MMDEQTIETKPLAAIPLAECVQMQVLDYRPPDSESSFLQTRVSIAFTFVLVFGFALFLAVPRFSHDHAGARLTAARTQVSGIATAIEAFQVDTARYPDAQEGLDALVTEPPGVQNWHSYMKTVPVDPWNHSYIYQFPALHHSDGFDLFSMGPDGLPNTPDDITNW